MTLLTEHPCADTAAMNASMADAIEHRLAAAIASRGEALLAVSGGKSPIGWFERLSSADLDWSKVSVLLVDERWVDESSDDSNAALVRRHLLRNAAKAARLVPLFNGGLSPFSARADLERLLGELDWPLDVAVLGMGADGHTASWFPDAPEYVDAVDENSSRRVAAIKTASSPYPRITLTRAALLNQCNWVAVEWSGAAKAPTYDRAKAALTPNLPISLMLHQDRVPVEVWFAR
ncbi:6-phosphogluconolactonase [soil metagenome]